MFPKSQIKIIFLLFFSTFYLNAWLFLGLWFGQQLISGVGNTITVQSAATSGVAWWAHIGGFVFGLIAGFYFRKKYLGKGYDKTSKNEDVYV
jgi:membrane associated rhomboid family serine protease